MASAISKKISQPECSLKCRSKKDASSLISVICRSSDLESLCYLISAGICGNAGKVSDTAGRTALHLAASVGKLQVLQWLLEFKNAAVNAKDGESGYTPLHRAIFHGQLHIAKVLVSTYSANLSVTDFDGFTPLDHVSADRATMPKSYGHHFKRSNDKCNAYLWGSNSNYNLGLGHDEQKTSPEINEFFRKENLRIHQVDISKFHSVFLTEKGTVYTCGHGRGGRLGQGHYESLLMPKIVRGLNDHIIDKVSVSIDHSLFLTSNGQVFACGLNDYGQLGVNNISESSTPILINGNKTKLPNAQDISACKFHSVFWNDENIYTWGLNAGQLGHLKSSEKIIHQPKLVSSIKGQGIKSVTSTDGAIIVYTRNHDLLALNEYQTRKIASKLNSVAKIEAIGGHLDPKSLLSTKSLLVDKGGQDLIVFVLSKMGRILVWQSKVNTMVPCLFNVQRELWITDMVVHKSGLLLVSRDGSAFSGTHISRAIVENKSLNSPSSEKFFKFIEKDQCDTIKVKRIPFIHRATRAASDPKGNNFCVLQIHPGLDLCDLPQVERTTLQKDMRDLYSENYGLEDFVIKVEKETFNVHKYVLAASGLEDLLICAKEEEEGECDLTSAVVQNQTYFIKNILQYAYFQDCDMLKGERLPFKMKVATSNVVEENYSNGDLKKAAHVVYKTKKKEQQQPAEKNPLNVLQSLSRSHGLHDLAKTLENYTFNSQANCLKKKKEYNKKRKSWARTKFENLSDVTILSNDDKEFPAHKCMLAARLDYFRSMFSMGWVESKKSTTVNLPLNGTLIQTLLEYVYTDFESVPSEDPEYLCNVLVMADQLLVPRLVQICEKQLAALLTLRNVGEILQLASEFNAFQLKKCCMDFVCCNFGALLETRGLDVVDNEILGDVSKHYQSLNRALASRIITPYSHGPSTEDIETHVANLEATLEDLLEHEGRMVKEAEPCTSSSSNKKKRTRRISTESNSSSENEDLNVSRGTLEADSSILDDFDELEIKEEPQEFQVIQKKPGKQDKDEEDVVKSFFENPKQFQKKFTKVSQKERKRLLALNSSNEQNGGSESKEVVSKQNWAGWGAGHEGGGGGQQNGLAFIMKAEEEERQINRSLKGGNIKRVRKQSWRSLSFEESSSPQVNSPVTNPWKTVPKASSPDKEAVVQSLKPSLHEILQEECVQSANLSRAQSKPFHITQLEEKAMAELRAFYNINNVHDEVITVERVDKRVLATPVWKRNKK